MNFAMQNTFFREITFLALTFFPREKVQCHFQKFRQFDEFFRENNGFGINFFPLGEKPMPLSKNFVNLTNFSVSP